MAKLPIFHLWHAACSLLYLGDNTSESCRREGRLAAEEEAGEEATVGKTNLTAIESLRQFCAALIEELAALGGEEKLFNHMKNAVETAAAEGNLAALRATWDDLKIWTRSLTDGQRTHVAVQMRQKFGMTFASDGAGSARDLLIPDPPENLENENR